jgi:4a-hydroxytetrahydrobiopterin dehydratase
MSIIDEDKNMKKIKDWILDREGTHKINKQFEFKDFKETMVFVNKVADIAEAEGHHPDIYIYYNKVKLELYTHAVKGLFLNDFIVAAKIDALEK